MSKGYHYAREILKERFGDQHSITHYFVNNFETRQTLQNPRGNEETRRRPRCLPDDPP